MGAITHGLFVAGAVACKSLAIGAVDAGVLSVVTPKLISTHIRANPIPHLLFFASLNMANTALLAASARLLRAL